MTAFAFVRADGIPFGGGSVPLGYRLPPNAVPLPEGADITAISRLRWTGEGWEDRTEPLPEWPVEEDPVARAESVLREAQTGAKARVNALVEAFRARFATPGQAEIYAVKLAQAQALVLNWFEPVDLSPWPAIVAEVGITAPTAWEVAQIVLHQAARARNALIASEALRQAALNAIATATDFDALPPIYATLLGALNGLSIQEF